jgi:hypothetical protein
MKMEQCSETSAYKIQTPGNYPEERIKQIRVYLVQVSYMFQPYVDTNRLTHKKETSSQWDLLLSFLCDCQIETAYDWNT